MKLLYLLGMLIGPLLNFIVSAHSMPTCLEVIANETSLSSLTGLLLGDKEMMRVINSVTGSTLLAPNNIAINAFFNNTELTASLQSDPHYRQAFFDYHIIPETHGISGSGKEIIFYATELLSTAYTNVTGGQRFKAISNGHKMVLKSGLNNTSIIGEDMIFCNNGSVVLQTIDRVLMPPADFVSTANSLTSVNISMAVNAFQALNLSNSLTKTKDVTYLIPNNATFERFGSLTMNRSVADIEHLLKFHIVLGGSHYTATLVSGTTLSTWAGANQTINLTVSLDRTEYRVNSAHIIASDLLVANGVIHVIDAVLEPTTLVRTSTISATSTTHHATMTVVPVDETTGLSMSTETIDPATTGIATTEAKTSSASPATSTPTTATRKAAAPRVSASYAAGVLLALVGGMILVAA